MSINEYGWSPGAEQTICESQCSLNPYEWVELGSSPAQRLIQQELDGLAEYLQLDGDEYAFMQQLYSFINIDTEYSRLDPLSPHAYYLRMSVAPRVAQDLDETLAANNQFAKRLENATDALKDKDAEPLQDRKRRRLFNRNYPALMSDGSFKIHKLHTIAEEKIMIPNRLSLMQQAVKMSNFDRPTKNLQFLNRANPSQTLFYSANGGNIKCAPPERSLNIILDPLQEFLHNHSQITPSVSAAFERDLPTFYNQWKEEVVKAIAQNQDYLDQNPSDINTLERIKRLVGYIELCESI